MKYLIYDKEFLINHLAQEPYVFCKELQKLGWKLIDCIEHNFIKDILQQSCIVMFVTYNKINVKEYSIHKDCKIIYKVDDNHFPNENLNEMCKIATHIISPYAYLQKSGNMSFLSHPSKMLVPYSFPDFATQIEFNESPKRKILVPTAALFSGSEHIYPFRWYFLKQRIANVDCLRHPGYSNKYNELTNLAFYKFLNSYLCCFTDALVFNYVLLKNFEITGVGSLLLTDMRIQPHLEALGFKDYESCIFCNQETVEEKIKWILDEENKDQVNKIRKAGMELVRSKHLTSERAKHVDMLFT